MSFFKVIITSLLVVAIYDCQATPVNVVDFGAKPGGADCTPALCRALEACRKLQNPMLIFPCGQYHFYPDSAIERYFFISNNDAGLKRIAFPILHCSGLTIDGQGSAFVFHGFINPFIIDHCHAVMLKNFSIDFDRPFHSEGVITANNEDGVDIRISEDFPYQITNGVLQFIQSKLESMNKKGNSVDKNIIYEYGNLLEFDIAKRETAFMARDYYLKNTPIKAEDLGNRKVRVYLKDLKGKVGNVLVFHPSSRAYPGFLVTDCSDVSLHNVIIYHSCGMGIIAQRTHNIIVDHCKVTPSNGRMISTTADATHFVNCSGKIIISNNLFENQMDDAANIHGIYVQIVRQIQPNKVVVELKQQQQLGFDFLKAGSKVEFVQAKSLVNLSKASVVSAQRLNAKYTTLVMDKSLPANVHIGDAIAATGNYPALYIRNNIIRNNRARGLLLDNRGKTVVERNYFHTPGAAILFEGDASFWFEQGGVRDCDIRDNVFDNCMYGVWGKAVIDVGARIQQQEEYSRYNRNIRISKNVFQVFDSSLLLNVYCVDGLSWNNNTIVKDQSYPFSRSGTNLYKINYCDHVNIHE